MKKILYLFVFIGVMILSIVFVSYTIKNSEVNKSSEEVVKPVVEEKEEVVVIPEPAEGGALKISINNPDSLNPLLNKQTSVDAFLGLMFESLVVLDQNQMPSMQLAKTIDTSVNGTYMTIRLKENIKWHDEQPFTANDVVATIKMIKALGDESPYSRQLEHIQSAKATDEYTVDLILNRAYSGVQYALTFPIVPSHIYNMSNIKDTTVNPVGTGPYKFSNYVPMQELKLTKNTNYYDGLAYIDEVVGMIIRDEDAKLASMEADIANSLYTKKVDWSKFSSHDKWKINDFTTYFYDFIGFNFNNDLLKDPQLRQVMVMAVDRQKIINDTLLGYGDIVDAPIHPDSWLNRDDKIKYTYKPQMGKKLLEEANYTDSDGDGILEKDGKALKFNLLISNSEPTRQVIAEKIKEQWAEVGISLAIEVVDPAVFKERVDADSFDMFYGGWSLSPMADLTFAFGTDASGNYINYSNVVMDQLLQEAYKATDLQTMKESYSKLIEYIYDEVPYMSLFFRRNALITNETIYGDIEINNSNLFNGIMNWYVVTP